MTDKTTLFVIGDGGVTTGFANVLHSIIENLPPNQYDVHHLAINYRGDYYETVPWHHLYPAGLSGDYLGRNRVKPLVDKIKPDVVLILQDLWVQKDYIADFHYDIPIVSYFPVDSGPLQLEWVTHLTKVTAPVAYTEYGKSEVKKVAPTLSVQVIPHGIDTSKFYPINAREAKEQFLGGSIAYEDWIVLNANRNQPRKRIDLTIKGFCEFAKNKPDNVKLYLHMELEGAGWRIDRLMSRYEQAHRLYITSTNLSPGNSLSVEMLNLVYNSCDIGISTSGGEGWGLVPFEHAATGAPQLVPDNSASAELFADNRGLIMPVREESNTATHILTEHTVPSVATVAESLEYAYTHPEEMQAMADKMYKYITQDKFQWKNIAMQWHKLFQRVVR